MRVKNIRRLITIFILNCGYNLYRTKILLLNGEVDPRTANYYKNKRIIIHLPIKHGRGSIFYKLEKSFNPFAQALAGPRISPEIIKIRLAEYYSTVQPSDAIAWLGIETQDAPQFLGIEPWSVPLPWSTSTLREKKEIVITTNNKDNGKFSKNCNIYHGHAYFGPVSDLKLKIEVERYWSIYNSIKKKGFITTNRFDGQISADILVNEKGEWRYIISPGQHRAAVLSALGYKTIPILIKSIIYRNEFNCWPNVRSKLYTPKGALKVFDKIFDGRFFSLNNKEEAPT